MAKTPEASAELLDFVQKGLDKKYPAIVIRTALKKSGYADPVISAAFAQLRQNKPEQPAKMPSLSKFEDIPRPPPFEPMEVPAEDIPLPPETPAFLAMQPERSEMKQPASNRIDDPKRTHVRHVVAACLFLIAVILLMYAALAPMLLRVG